MELIKMSSEIRKNNLKKGIELYEIMGKELSRILEDYSDVIHSADSLNLHLSDLEKENKGKETFESFRNSVREFKDNVEMLEYLRGLYRQIKNDYVEAILKEKL